MCMEKANGGIWIYVGLIKLSKYVQRPIHPDPSQNEVISYITPK